MAYAKAVQELHAKILAPVATWREKVYGEGEPLNTSPLNTSHYVRTRTESHHAAAGLVTASSWQSYWAMQTSDEQLHEARARPHATHPHTHRHRHWPGTSAYAYADDIVILDHRRPTTL
jgi:hypothetical protein